MRTELEALYADHRQSLIRLALPFVDDLQSAEDVVQDAFLGLHRKKGELRDPQRALAYLRRSVVNGSRSTLRRRRTARAHRTVAEPATTDASDVSVLLASEHSQVLAAVRRLSPRAQQVLALRYWADMSDKEIASLLGIAVGSVRATVSRALDKLELDLEATS